MPPLIRVIMSAVLAGAAMLAVSGEVRSGEGRVRTWVCYYGSKDVSGLVGRFDLAVLDPATPVRFAPGASRPVLLGYLSLAEVNRASPLHVRIDGKQFAVGLNPLWNSTVVDVRSPEWRDVLAREAAAVLAEGFDGLFLDTADSAIHLERTDPGRYEGTNKALVDLVEELRRTWPDIPICLNRGMEIWPEVAEAVDFVLVEGLTSVYDHAEKAYKPVSEEDREFLLGRADRAREANPRLTVLSLDYAAPEDTALIRAATAFAREHEVVPYVSTYRLDTVFNATLDR